MKKTMLVAVDSFLPQITGVAIVSMEFIKRLSKHYDLIVFAPSHGFLNVEQVDAEFYLSPLIPFLNVHGFQACFPPLLMMRQAMKKVDIVFTHTFGPVGGLAIYLSAKFHIPCFAYCLSIDWELYPHALGLSGYMHRIVQKITIEVSRFLYGMCAALFVSSNSVASRIGDLNLHDRIYVIPLGVDTRRFQPSRNKPVSKTALGFKPSEVVIGYCGRISPEKNVELLLEACRSLRERFANIRLLIVGDGPEKLKKQLQASKWVTVTGYQDNVIPFFQAMDIHVLPSKTEVLSLVTMEAMACGVPCIASNVGGINDYLIHGYNGFLFESENQNQLEMYIEKLISCPTVRQRFGKRARPAMVEYDWDKNIPKIHQVIEKHMSEMAIRPLPQN